MKKQEIDHPLSVKGAFFVKAIIAVSVVFTFFLLPILAYSAEVKLAWNANDEDDLAGYRIHYGTSSGSYSTTVDVGDTTQYTVTGLNDGVTYYFAATAYDTSDNESGYSEEAIHTTGSPNSPPNTPATPSGPSSGYTGTDYNFSTSASDPDGDSVVYQYNWDDGQTSSWGASTRSHSWSTTGTFCVTARARDEHGALSAYSGCRNITINVTTHTITATSGANGNISPSGAVSVNQGANRSFTITPNANCHIVDVAVDGASVGAQTSYTFTNVAGDHSISASFALDNRNPNPPSQPSGPASGYVSTTYSYSTAGTDPDGDVLEYRFDWGDGGLSGWGGAFSRAHVFASTGNFCVKAQSQDTHGATSQWSSCLNVNIGPLTHTITASSGTKGSISPSGSVTVNNGANQTFSITPDLNYHVADVLVDGSSKGAVTSYTFTNVTGNHSIAASFALNNRAPVANAGADQSVMVNDSVQLNGTNSSDADGDTLTFQWSFVSRPSGSSASLSSTTAAKPSFDVDASGNYIVQLVVNDGSVNSSPDIVIVSTENSPPVANAGADQSVMVNDSVQLNGTNSSDADGDTLTFQWSFVSWPSGSNASLSSSTNVKPSFVVDLPGDYTVQLVVNDGTVDSSPDTVTISTENSPPVANAGADQSVMVNDSVLLNGTNSSDADGDTLTFQWSFVLRPSGSTASLSSTTAAKPSFDVDVSGNYIVQLIVNDGTDNSSSDTVTISTQNSPPVADAGADQSVMANDSVQLNGNNSSDADGDTLTYMWSFISRPSGSSASLSSTTAAKPSFVADVSGNYIVQLIVNDGTVNSSPDTVTISTQNSPPVADAGADQSMMVNDSVQLNGNNSSDADGDTLTYMWSFISRPSASSASLSKSNKANPSFVVDLPGDYTVQLIVNDGTTNSAPDTVTVSTENSPPVVDAGADQDVYEGSLVTLDGTDSNDPDGNIVSYRWEQTNGISVVLQGSNSIAAAFTAPDINTDGEVLTFKLTVSDADGLQAADYCTVHVTRDQLSDRDDDGVPDSEDHFPDDPNEWLDTDGDGIGNNADTDDDDDDMLDTWENQYGLDPLVNDADEDLDGDGISNIDEYNAGTNPTIDEHNDAPQVPVVFAPDNSDLVGLAPVLQTEEFFDPDYGDSHLKTQWQIFDQRSDECVLDIETPTALTSVTVPWLILDENTTYYWKVRFFDSQGTPSDWSEPAIFMTDINDEDSNGNGIPDHQEIEVTTDLDGDNTPDKDQDDIKCAFTQDGKTFIGIGVKDSPSVIALDSIAIDDPEDVLMQSTPGKGPTKMPFGLLHFKLYVDEPGDEAEVTIYFSTHAPRQGRWYKYDSIEESWLDFSAHVSFGRGRKYMILTLKDGGIGDADGVENGIIVDPSGVGTIEPTGGDDPVDQALNEITKLDPGCFIATASHQSTDTESKNLLHEIRGRELSIIFILLVVGIALKMALVWIRRLSILD